MLKHSDRVAGGARLQGRRPQEHADGADRQGDDPPGGKITQNIFS